MLHLTVGAATPIRRVPVDPLHAHGDLAAHPFLLDACITPELAGRAGCAQVAHVSA